MPLKRIERIFLIVFRADSEDNAPVRQSLGITLEVDKGLAYTVSLPKHDAL